MNKTRHTLNIGGIICIIAIVYFIYRVCLLNDILPFSIHSVHTFMNHCVKHWHVIVVALLPIYVALVVFGAFMFGSCFGAAAQRWLSRFFSAK